MIFTVGLNRLKQEEKILLLAQLNSLSTLDLFNEEIQKSAKKAKDWLFKTVKDISAKYGKDGIVNRVDELDRSLDWSPEIIQDKINKEIERLESLEVEMVNKELRNRLLIIAELKEDDKDEIIANAICYRAAKSMGLDLRRYLDAVSLESAVFEKSIKEIVDEMQKKMQSMTKEQINEFENILRSEINKLSSADQEAIKEVIGSNDLTATNLIKYIKTASTIAVSQIIIGSFGFGWYLFLTTMLKSLGLLLGISFSFGTYAAVTTVSAFILSIPFLIIMLAVSGGVIFNKTSKKIDDELAKVVILIGRGKLLSKN